MNPWKDVKFYICVKIYGGTKTTYISNCATSKCHICVTVCTYFKTMSKTLHYTLQWYQIDVKNMCHYKTSICGGTKTTLKMVPLQTIP